MSTIKRAGTRPASHSLRFHTVFTARKTDVVETRAAGQIYSRAKFNYYLYAAYFPLGKLHPYYLIFMERMI